MSASGHITDHALRRKHVVIGLVDQSVVSATTFGSIFIAGWLLPAAMFVQYMLLVAAAALIQTVCASLIAVPAVYLTNSTPGYNSRTYVIWLFILVSGIAITGGAIGAVFVSSGGPGFNYILAAGLGAAWSSFDVSRRLLISTGTFARAAISSSITLVTFGTLVSALSKTAVLTEHAIAGSLALSYISGLVIMLPRLSRDARILPARIHGIMTVVREHWAYSSWLLLGSALFWLYTQGFLFVLAAILTDNQTARFRILLNLASAASVLLIWLENHYGPIFTRLVRDVAFPVIPLRYTALRHTCAVIGMGYFICWTPLVAAAYHVFYADRFGPANSALILFACSGQTFLLLSRSEVVMMRAIGATRITTEAHLASLIAVALLGAHGASVYGPAGAMGVLAMGAVVFYAVMYQRARHVLHTLAPDPLASHS